MKGSSTMTRAPSFASTDRTWSSAAKALVSCFSFSFALPLLLNFFLPRSAGAYAYNPHLKMLCNDVDFLTQKMRAGDTAVYVGGSIGEYILILANMFPTTKFVMYDHNLSNCIRKVKEEGSMPPNLHHREEVFSEKVAAQLLLQDSLKSSKLLLMSDLRNITRNAWGNEGQVAVTDDNVVNDLHLQENWVQLLRPRSAQLKFKLPYHGPSQYSYLKGDVKVQLFGKHSTSEVRLTVDAPADELQEYPRFLFDKQQHEDSMYHHNFVTRLQHTEAPNRIRISFDQNAAHHIFAQWKERALADASISGIKDAQERRDWVMKRICELDQTFDRSLGLRVSQQLRDDVLCFLHGSVAVVSKENTRKRMSLWKKNLKGKRDRNRKGMQQQQQQPRKLEEEEEEEEEDGEIRQPH